MLKGCLKSVAIVIFLTAVVYYLVDKYGADFWAANKTKVVETTYEKLIADIDLIDDDNSEALKQLVSDFFNKIDFDNLSESYSKIKKFFATVSDVISDSKIGEDELIKLKEWSINE